MQFRYFLFYALAWLFSIMPMPLLWLLSDAIYLLLYKAFGYRKEVVRKNIQNSFPNWNEHARLKLEKEFFKYFSDLLVESLKLLTISPKSLKESVTIEGFELFKEQSDQGRSAVVVMGHQGNWEYAGARYALENYPQLYALYHPLKNKAFDRLICKIRTRLGNRLYKMRSAGKAMMKNKENTSVVAFIADQTPPKKGAYWTSFLNQDTPVFLGTAKLSKKLNFPVIYISIKRTGRGKYHLKAELLTDDPNSFTDEELTDLHTKRLEQDIFDQPEIWLWSHRRWKHRRESS